MIKSKIISSGSYLPLKILTNDDLSKIVDTSDEWIFQRTGIKERRIAESNETTSFMAKKALENAIQKINFNPIDLDCIIVATTTPDFCFPSTACIVQNLIGAKNASAFDVQAVCSGFIYALTIADSYIKSEKYKNIAVIGSDKLSSIVDWTDRNTCVLFGDGAGCVILSKSDNESGIIDWKINSDGKLCEILKTNGLANSQSRGFIEMNGKEVFKYATTKMIDTLIELLEKNSLNPLDLSCVIAHQANARIISYVAEKLNLPIEKFPMTLEKHGNTSAASIPLAFDEWISLGKIKEGDLIALEAVGGGMTNGCLIFKF